LLLISHGKVPLFAESHNQVSAVTHAQFARDTSGRSLCVDSSWLLRSP
jgi:hypothetical protein